MPTTGIAPIDTVSRAVGFDAGNAQRLLGVPSTGQDALENALGTSTRPFTISRQQHDHRRVGQRHDFRHQRAVPGSDELPDECRLVVVERACPRRLSPRPAARGGRHVVRHSRGGRASHQRVRHGDRLLRLHHGRIAPRHPSVGPRQQHDHGRLRQRPHRRRQRLRDHARGVHSGPRRHQLRRQRAAAAGRRRAGGAGRALRRQSSVPTTAPPPNGCSTIRPGSGSISATTRSPAAPATTPSWQHRAILQPAAGAANITGSAASTRHHGGYGRSHVSALFTRRDRRGLRGGGDAARASDGLAVGRRLRVQWRPRQRRLDSDQINTATAATTSMPSSG